MGIFRWLRSDGGALASLALFKLALHFSTIGLYGYHRDELYLLACGKRLEWGSVDHAPVTPAISRGLALAFGESPAGQRVVAAVAGSLVVWLTGLCARRLGGDRTAQLLAAGSVLICPVFLYSSGVNGTNAIDQLVWVLASYLLLVILTERESRRTVAVSWLAIGFVIGVGLLNKYTILVYGASLFVGLVATPARAHLRTPWPYAAAAVAAIVWLPNLVWQLAHDFPVVEFMWEHHAARLREVAVVSFFLDQPRLINIFSFVVALIGLVSALRPRAVSHERTFGVMFLATLFLFLLSRGKPYYLAPLYPALIAIGAVRYAPALLGWRASRRRMLGIAWVIAGAIAFIGTLPVLPPQTAVRLGLYRLNRELVQFADWADVVSQIAAAYHTTVRSPRGGILTDSYGTASAIEVYGPAMGLPPPLSGANGYHAWGPHAEPDELLSLGYPLEILSEAYEEVTPVGQVRGPFDLDNRFDFPRVIYLCRGERRPLGQISRSLRRFD